MKKIFLTLFVLLAFVGTTTISAEARPHDGHSPKGHHAKMQPKPHHRHHRPAPKIHHIHHHHPYHRCHHCDCWGFRTLNYYFSDENFSFGISL